MSIAAPSATRSATAALKLLPGLLVIVCLLVLFRDTVGEMIATYDRSETFAHAYLVPLISVWLVWRQRFALAGLRIKPEPWALLPMAAACLLWLVGELAVVNAATQFALVTLIILTVPALYGMAYARALMFPLMFLYFAVPTGLFLVPLMMEHTANFTVMALQFTGVPVYREGLQFVIPSGNWSVVEACSGVRYLIASFMVGTLFAYLNYTSWKRRLLFIAVSIAVPVVANWLRAYMIVMLGHLSGNTLAVGVDHLIYGWVFFGLVIGIMFAIGARWSQPNDPPVRASRRRSAMSIPSTGLWGAAVASVLLMVAVQSAMWMLGQPRADTLAALKLPTQLGADWTVDGQSFTNWAPAFSGARQTDQRNYVSLQSKNSRGELQTVAAWSGYYRDQDRRSKMVTSNNTLIPAEQNPWAQVSTSTQVVNVRGQDLAFKQALLRGPGAPGSASAQRLLVWQIYWLGDDSYTASDARAKLSLAFKRLRGRGDDAAVLMLYLPIDGSAKSQEEGEAALRQLVSAHLDRFEASFRTLATAAGAP